MIKFNPLSKDPIEKSERRHGLKEIDKKWAGRKVAPPQKALSNAEKAIRLHETMAKKEHEGNKVEKHFGSFEERLKRFKK
jgi:hypothetical protein